MTAYTIKQLRGMTAAQADAALCAMHSEAWYSIGEALGLRLPIRGGDKPSIIVGALFGR